MWPEVFVAKNENRRELVLTGKLVAKKIEEEGLDENIFDLTQLNFLEITRSDLPVVSNKLSQLLNLTSLSLHCNKLNSLPACIGELTKLKMLDVSMNNLSDVPEELSSLLDLQSLNFSNNNLTEFICVSGFSKLQSLDISNNKLKKLPSGIDSPDLKLLMTLSALNNEIEFLPENLNMLPSLKLLDVSNNKLDTLPPSLGDSGKLKELRCTGNKLKDGRLMKLLNQNLTKAALDYLKSKNNEDAKGKASKKNKKDGKDHDLDCSEDRDLIKVLTYNADSKILVKTTDDVAKVRPYIVCCVVRNLNFHKSPSLMKRFIKIQAILHEDLCAKRQVATIATHDLEKLTGPLLYCAKNPSEIMIHPLKMPKEVSAKSLVDKLKKEAEEIRKAKKRNTVSGVHKYLNLLSANKLYPCIIDATGLTISFPPITNCDHTKVTESTRHILIEVTGSSTLDSCKKVMEEILVNLLQLAICQEEEPPLVASDAAGAPERKDKSDDEDDAEAEKGEVKQGRKLLIVEQVRVVDPLNNLRVVYPSRTDLESDKFRVTRGQEHQ